MHTDTAENQAITAITGATTGTGRRLVRKLLDQNRHLRCLVHTPERSHLLPKSSNLEIQTGDASQREDIKHLLKNAHTLIHLAGQRFTPLLLDILSAPREPLRLVVQSSTRALSRFDTEVRRAVLVSEIATQKAPDHVQWTILRPSMIFGGPEDNNIERLADFMKSHRFFPVFGKGENLVQPCFVQDLADAHIAALANPHSIGKAYNIAGPEAVTYNDLLKEVARAANLRKPRVIHVPYAPALHTARILRRFWGNCPLSPEMIERFGEDRAFDITPAQTDLGFNPTPLPEALAAKFARSV